MDLHTINQTITDPADWDGSLFGTQMELVQLSGSEFRSSQKVTQLDGVQLLRLTVNQPATVRSRPLSLRYVATIFDNSHEGHYAGAPMESGKLLILPPAFDFDACVKDTAFNCSAVFAVPEQVESYYRTLTGRDIRQVKSVVCVSPDSDALRWLSVWPELVEPAKLGELSIEQRSNIQESLRDSALTMIVSALESADPSDAIDSKSKLAKARQLVRIAEDYANSSPNIGVRMVDLCRETEVSERTLQYAFQSCLGISPINYLKRHRLHRVRRTLKAAEPAKTTVSAIACQFGFFHFGEFSQAYKAQFDESPSQTLKQT